MQGFNKKADLAINARGGLMSIEKALKVDKCKTYFNKRLLLLLLLFLLLQFRFSYLFIGIVSEHLIIFDDVQIQLAKLQTVNWNFLLKIQYQNIKFLENSALQESSI